MKALECRTLAAHHINIAISLQAVRIWGGGMEIFRRSITCTKA